MSTKILHGDCRDVLKTLADASVQCCVTSPPYWGLRDYGVDATIWGGDPECEHEWGDVIAVNATNHTDKRRWNHTRNGRDEEQPTEKRVAWLRTKVPQGKFCQHCNAWAGALGLEPTPDLFIEHIVEVFAEVRRVLRDDGILLMNLGDSYSANGGAHTTGSYDGGTGRGMSAGRLRKSPNGLKPKDLIGIPWMAAFALRADGWWLRRDIIWSKPNPMPESVTDRPTSAHEYVFLLTKSARYFWDAEAVREPMAAASVARLAQDVEGQKGSLRANGGAKTNGPMKAVAKGNAKTFRGGGAYTGGRSFDNDAVVERDSHGNAPNESGSRNLRSVWTIATQPYSEAHFATFPPALAERCILAGSRPGDTVLDPFGGAGTVGLVADRLGRDAVLIELNESYIDIAKRRLTKDAGMFAEIT